MEENHLEYGYLEGESIGGHFAEDPVGVSAVLWGSLVANVKGAVTFFVCAHVSSASNNNKKMSRWLGEREPKLRAVASLV